MTLTTRIAIVEPTAVREVFDECRRLIGGENAEFKHEPSSWRPGITEYRNRIAQGLPALLWVYYGMEAPIVPEPDEEDPDWRQGYPPVDGWSIEVCFDTTYSYRENGAGCSDLHAWLVQELGKWLSGQRLTWFWYHEYMGQWHPSSDPITILGNPILGRLTPAPRAQSA